MKKYSIEDTIAAISTPPGTGLKSIIRISGRNSHEIAKALVQKMLVKKDQLQIFKSPYSYTGENLVEIYLNGSHFSSQILLEKIIALDSRPATEGEFTLRAFLNGKMDLAQAEAINNLISSASSAEALASLTIIDGKLSSQIRNIEMRTTELLGDIEAEIDFLDQDIEIISTPEIKRRIGDITSELENLVRETSVFSLSQNTISCLLYGKTNAGKTTLFNRLSETNSIVSDIHGTTRDLIYGEAMIDGIKFRFIDSPGVLNQATGIDSFSNRQTLNAIKDADLILAVLDATNLSTDNLSMQNRPVVIAVNKIDISMKRLENDAVYISALQGIGLDDLKRRLVKTVSGLDNDAKFRVTMRQKTALHNAIFYLNLTKDNLENPELLALDVREALYELAQITGKNVTDEILTHIFSKFCIGK